MDNCINFSEIYYIVFKYEKVRASKIFIESIFEFQNIWRCMRKNLLDFLRYLISCV